MIDCNWRMQGTILIFSASGTILPGSEGNPSVMDMARSLQNATDINRDASGLILDFIHLHYTFGDHLAKLWTYSNRRRIPMAIVADDGTAGSLLTLMAQTKEVPIFASIDIAIRSFSADFADPNPEPRL